MNDYLQFLDKNASKSVWIALPMTVATMIISCILIPCLLKNLRGHSKVYLILQHLSANVFLIMMATAITIETRPKDFISFAAGGYRAEAYIKITAIFENIFYYQQYSYSLLQSLNFYHMICNPLQYCEYTKPISVIKRVVVCLLFSFLLPLPSVLERMVVTFVSRNNWSLDLDLVKDVIYFNRIYCGVVACLLKVGYTVILSIISVRVRSSLAESREIRNDEATISPLFVTVCLVPLVNNVLYLGSEIPRAIFDYRNNVHSDFKRDKVYYSDFKYDEEYFDPDWRFYELTFILTASVYLMASVVQCSAYLICFPQLRRGLCDVFSKLQCAKSTQDQQTD